MTKDYDKAVQKLNEIICFAPKKYSKHFYLIRGVVFEELGQREKSKKDLEKFEKADPKGYA
jgi:tetratricopeptide (TPR) repeat protein